MSSTTSTELVCVFSISSSVSSSISGGGGSRREWRGWDDSATTGSYGVAKLEEPWPQKLTCLFVMSAIVEGDCGGSGLAQVQCGVKRGGVWVLPERE